MGAGAASQRDDCAVSGNGHYRVVPHWFTAGGVFRDSENGGAPGQIAAARIAEDCAIFLRT